MTELQEKLFDTMIQFTNYAGEHSTSVKTISGVIKEIVDEDKCIYKVEYMGQLIEVFSAGNVHYQLEDYVYILLPQGDFSGKKIIISLVEPEAREGSGGEPVNVIAISAEKITALF